MINLTEPQNNLIDYYVATGESIDFRLLLNSTYRIDNGQLSFSKDPKIRKAASNRRTRARKLSEAGILILVRI